MNINTNYNNISNLYTSMYQGNMSLFNNKLSRSLFPANKAQGKDSLDSNAIGYVTNIKTAAKSLGSAVNQLSGSAFSNRTMTSSNSDVLSVNYSGNNANTIAPMTVKVKQIATSQQNAGKELSANTTFEGKSGVNRFSIEKDGKTTDFSINVSAGDKNKDVQQKMADAVNQAGIGVKATVETDTKTNTSTLKLESTNTGSSQKNTFVVKDATGDLAAKTGINAISQEGRDAVYSVNGGAERTSQSNNINLGNGVTATLKKASEEEVTVSRGKNIDLAIATAENLVKSYNDLYVEAAQRTNDAKSQKLATKMVNTSKTYFNSLSEIGIGFNGDGKMTIDSKKMNQAAESGKLEKFFTENSGRNYGFTNQIGKLADSVSRNTGSYVSSSQIGKDLTDSLTYSGLGDLIQYNFLSAGSIFDYSF